MDSRNLVGRMFFFYHASSYILRIEPVQIRQNVSFQKVDIDGFGSTISEDGREERNKSAE